MILFLIIVAFALCALAPFLFSMHRLPAGWIALLGANCLFITQDVMDGGTVSLIAAGVNAAAGLFCVLHLAQLRRSGA